MLHEFNLDDEVRVIRNIRDDGTFPGADTGDLLIKAGAVGVVREMGTFLQDQVIYTVHFFDEDRVIGCREPELQLASEPWFPAKFESRTYVVAAMNLGSEGEILVQKGAEGYVMKVVRDRPDQVCYRVHFASAEVLVPESAIMASDNTRVHRIAGV